MAETGHAKNVENWQKMIAVCTGFGGDYKPSNANLTVGSMTTLLTDVETEMDGIQTSIVPCKNKVADRENIYSIEKARCALPFASGFFLYGRMDLANDQTFRLDGGECITDCGKLFKNPGASVLKFAL